MHYNYYVLDYKSY